VFAALTKDVGGWWGHPFVTARATCLALDPRLGGLFTERWDNGGQVIASVTGWAQEPARHWPRRTNTSLFQGQAEVLMRHSSGVFAR